MAGFYGNISASNRTAFTFDKIYSTRKQMDEAVTTDGIFLGRYVLVEYDNPPLTGYYNPADGEFYGDVHYSAETLMEKIPNQLYQNLATLNSTDSFYLCQQAGNGNALVYVQYEGSASSFAASYNIDVRAYGRGYDSTVWMKIVDSEINRYRYVLVAEMNTVVPNFHLVIDPPNTEPTGPYFDNSTTNLDYYMHVQSAFTHKIRTVRTGEPSDEKIDYIEASYDSGTGSWVDNTVHNVPGDIYYNKAGFSMTNHNPDLTTVNCINYELLSSEKPIYGKDNAAHEQNGLTAKDQYGWYIHLPAIGNAISTVWDLMFTPKRKLELLKDSHANLENCTVDTDSVFGVINSARCYVGKVTAMPPLAQANDDGSYSIYATDAGGTLQYNRAILFLDDLEDYRHYWFPNYTNKWIRDDVNGDYYRTSEGAYRVANKLTDPAPYYRRESGHPVSGPHWRFTYSYKDNMLHMASGMAAVEADMSSEVSNPTTVYGAIALVNRILGTGLSVADSRDDRTVIGMMNRMKDMVENIDKNLPAKKFVVTNEHGVITASSTDFPYVGTGNHQELLDSSGTWRLPVSYKLESLNLRNTTNNATYFDAGYYGNSCLHAVLATDTLGEAIRKMQNEMADIQYQPQEITTFSVTLTGGEKNLLENGALMTSATIDYTLNKGPRKSIVLERTAPNDAAVTLINTTNIDPEAYVTNSTAYAASAHGPYIDNNTMTSHTDATMTWSLHVTDERSVTADATVHGYWVNRYYYGIGSAITNLTTINTRAKLNNVLSGGGNKLARSKASLNLTMNPGANQHMFYMQPASWAMPTFKVGGFEGNMDLLMNGSKDYFEFTNANGYTTNYRIWQSTQANLGNTVLSIS